MRQRGRSSSAIRNAPGVASRALMSAAGAGPAEAVALHASARRPRAGTAAARRSRRPRRSPSCRGRGRGSPPHARSPPRPPRVRCCARSSIDLELVEREATQIEQAGIAGAEIVEREPHAQRLEAEHGELGGVHIAEQRAFGDLELEPGRIEIGLATGCARPRRRNRRGGIAAARR